MEEIVWLAFAKLLRKEQTDIKEDLIITISAKTIWKNYPAFKYRELDITTGYLKP